MSLRKSNDDGPIGTIGDRIGNAWIILNCGGLRCGHSQKYDPLDLAATYGRDCSMKSLVARGRCSVCGHRGASLIVSPPTARDGSDALKSE